MIIDIPVLVTSELMKTWLSSGNSAFPRMGEIELPYVFVIGV